MIIIIIIMTRKYWFIYKKKKKKKSYIIQRGEELTCFHFFEWSCWADRGFGVPWCFPEMFLPVEGQVVFLSREAQFVGVGLRAAEVSCASRSRAAWGSGVVHGMGRPLHICVRTFPCVGESF